MTNARLLAAVNENSTYIAKQIKAICTAHGEECEGCNWFDKSIDIGCVWRTHDDVAPCDWEDN